MELSEAWAMELSEPRTAQGLAQGPLGAQARAEEEWARAMEVTELRAQAAV